MSDKHEKAVEENLHLLAKSSVIVFIGIFLSKIFTYIYRAIVARYFGPETYGVFSLALMIMGWLVAFSTLGLTEGLLRYIPTFRSKQQTEKIQHILKFSIFFCAISSCITGIILFLFANYLSLEIFHEPNLVPFLKWFSILIPIWVFSHLFLQVIRAYEKISVNSFLVNIFQNVIKLALLILFILFGFKQNSIIFSTLLGMSFLLMASFLYCRFKLPNLFIPPQINKEEKKKISLEMITFSLPVMMQSFMLNIFYWIDSFSLGYLKTATEVGIYNSAVFIALLLFVLPELFMQLFFPMITREYAQNNFKLANELIKQVGKWIFLFNLPIFLLMLIFPGAFINIFFGIQYIGAENSLRFLVFGTFMFSIAIVSNNILISSGKSKLVLVDLIVTSLINLIMNFLLIPNYGITGAAAATTISFGVLSILLFFQSKKYLSALPFRRKMVLILAISVVPLLITFKIRGLFGNSLFSLIMLVIFFFCLYFLLILISKSLDKNDIGVAKAFINKARTKYHNIFNKPLSLQNTDN